MTNLKRLEVLEASSVGQADKWLCIATPCGPDCYRMSKMDGRSYTFTGAELPQLGAMIGQRIIILDR